MGKQNKKKHVVPWQQEHDGPYQALFEQSALGIIVLSAGGRWVQANESFCRLLGYSRGELWKQAFPHIIHAEDRAACMDLFHRIATGELATGNLFMRCLRRDGTLVRVKVTLSASGQRASRHYAVLGFVEEAGVASQPLASSQEQLLEKLERLELLLTTTSSQAEIRTLGHELATLTRSVLDYALAERDEALARIANLREARTKIEDFLSLAGHELRTPLTTIKANTQLAMRRLRSVMQRPEWLLEGADDKIQASLEMLERSERQIGVLNRQVGDMLDVSRIQGNRLQVHIHREPCDLRLIIEAAMREQHKMLPARTITVHFPGVEPILIKADPDRLQQVLNNYLLNALKYSEARQPVRVEVQLEPIAATGGPQVRVTVLDKGPGIALEEQARIWECFYQSPTIKAGGGSGLGMGLGLYISQALIERQGGQVGVISTLDEGSAFWFTLPLAQVERAATEN